MEKLFTIGEISKLANIPIKTLRYYDEIGLLKPICVNEVTKYRYYSVEQFVAIDLIKQFKATGISLTELKKILSSESSIEVMLQSIHDQSKILDKKIQEILKLKNYLNNLEKDISENMNYGLEEIFIKHNKERDYIKYEVVSSSVEELDLNLRNIVLEIEKNKDNTAVKIGNTVSYKDLKYENKIRYTGFKVFTTTKKVVNYLPEGDYITIIYEGSLKESKKYYEKLLEYIASHNIEVVGDFNETWIIGRVDEKLQEKSLIKIDIMKK